MPLVWLSVGSNIDPDRHLRACHAALHARYADVHCSPVYRSPPVGLEGDDFLNAVVQLRTVEPVASVQAWCKKQERLAGRDARSRGFSSRTLDLDILLYDDLVIDSDGIRLPRDEITEQAFVLVPLADIAGERRHPVLGQSYAVLLESLRRDKPDAVAALTRYPLFDTTTGVRHPPR